MVGSWQGFARLLVVCVVLAGLFLMHGAPASAAEGCHSMTSASMLAPMPGTGGHSAATAPSGHRAVAHGVGGQSVQAGTASTGHGVMCVSTPAREHTLLPPHALLLLLVVVAMLALWMLAGPAAVRGRAGRRGPPPPGGRGLLLQVGIARN